MRPNFKMSSDSVDPSIKTCTGYWDFPGYVCFSQRFKTGKECMAMNDVIQAAYYQGVNDGRHETKLLVQQALKNIY